MIFLVTVTSTSMMGLPSGLGKGVHKWVAKPLELIAR
jgi:hypothetical protein